MKKPRTHTRKILVTNLVDVLRVVDQLPCAIFWRSGYRHFTPDLKYKEQAYAGVARACLESTLMSLRSLDEFFTAGGCPDDIRADDYPGFRGAGGFLSMSKRRSINKHIAHFTVARTSNPVLLWAYNVEIVNAAEKITKFLDYLTTDFLSAQDDITPHVKRLQESLTFFVVEVGASMDLVVDEYPHQFKETVAIAEPPRPQ
jgi:hypothetical protein